ncbi:MAG: HEAT repeat domain-containing protein, partial [Geminicoccaceae bacterium]
MEKTGGRQKGTPNKATADIRALAQEHGPKAIKKLVALVFSEDERVQVQAIKELLDRGYGKSAQPLTGADLGPIQSEDVT